MVKVLFANHAQFEGQYTNLGDWAIFEEMIDRFQSYVDDGEMEVLVPSSDPDYTNTHYPVKAFKRGGFAGILNTFKAIVSSDIVVIGGGEIVQDRSSMVYIPYQLIRPFVAKLFGKKLFGYAIGVGEEEEISFIGRIQSSFVLNMFDIITVRDKKSYRVLKNYLKVRRPRVYLTADPALNLKPRKAEDLPEKPYVVVSARSVYHREHNILPFSIRKKLGLVPEEYYKEIERFKTDLAFIADQTAEKYNYNICFLNTYTGKQMSAQDDSFTNDIINKMKNKDSVSVIPADLTPSQIKYALGNAELILSVPLHPLILGSSENVPVLSIAYASKNKCFMKQICHPEHIYSVETIGERLDTEQILNDINSVVLNENNYLEELKNRMALLKKREMNNSKLFLRLVDCVKKREEKKC